jgi:hypothetical protein
MHLRAPEWRRRSSSANDDRARSRQGQPRGARPAASIALAFVRDCGRACPPGRRARRSSGAGVRSVRQRRPHPSTKRHSASALVSVSEVALAGRRDGGKLREPPLHAVQSPSARSPARCPVLISLARRRLVECHGPHERLDGRALRSPGRACALVWGRVAQRSRDRARREVRASVSLRPSKGFIGPLVAGATTPCSPAVRCGPRSRGSAARSGRRHGWFVPPYATIELSLVIALMRCRSLGLSLTRALAVEGVRTGRAAP